MDEVGRVDVAPFPLRHVAAHARLQLRDRLVEGADENLVAGCGSLRTGRTIRAVGRRHPRDDLLDVVRRERRAGRHAGRVRFWRHLQHPVLVQCRRRRITIERHVPGEQRVNRALRVTGRGRNVFQQWNEASRRQRCDVVLQRFHVLNRELPVLGQHLGDAVVAVRRAVLVPEGNFIARDDLSHDVIVRRVVEMLRRVEALRQLIERNVSVPFVLALGARHRQQAIPILPHRRLGDAEIADVAVDVRIHETV